MFLSGPRARRFISSRAVWRKGPILVRGLSAFAWSFRRRRQLLNAWTAWELHPGRVACSNFLFGLRNPWVFRMRREVRRAVATGRTVILA